MALKEILLINPRRKARKTAKRAKRARAKISEVKPMARKRTRRAAPKRRRRVYANPRRTAPRRKARRSISKARSVVGSTLRGLNIRGAMGHMPAMLVGMFAAKWAAKRWGADAAATEDSRDSWTWASYLKGALGGVVASVAAQSLKPGSGQKVLEGAAALLVYKAVNNELVPKSEWAMKQFGAEMEYEGADDYQPDEYAGAEGYLPGDVVEGSDGSSYLLGSDYSWQEVGDELAPVTHLGANILEPVGPLGEYDPALARVFNGDDVVQHGSVNDPYARAFFRA